MLGDLVSAGLGVQGMLWATSPAGTELETVMLDWLADLLDLPARFRSTGTGGGVIQDSASSATLVATLAALHRASGGRWRHRGRRPPVHRLHLDAGPLLDREGGPAGRARRRRASD